MFLSLCAVLFSSLLSSEIALFRDWCLDEAPISLEAEGAESALARRLQKEGDVLVPWKKEAYREALSTWRSIENWEGAVQWVRSWGKLANLVPETDRYWFFWGLGPTFDTMSLQGLPKEKLVLFLFEPPTVQPRSYDPKTLDWFGAVFTWDDDVVDGKRFFKFHYPVWGEPLEGETVPFAEKRFCAMINRRLSSRFAKELYSEREKTIQSFEKRPDLSFDLFGFFWEKRGYRSWRGPLLEDKLRTLQKYKFCVCYENTRDVKGYITEKIFDCLRAGAVPVYWGAENIGDYVPKECFIDRRLFSDSDALIAFLESVSPEEHKAYVEAGRKFLMGKEARAFSKEAFAETIARFVYETKPSS